MKISQGVANHDIRRRSVKKLFEIWVSVWPTVILLFSNEWHVRLAKRSTIHFLLINIKVMKHENNPPSTIYLSIPTRKKTHALQLPSLLQ